MKHLFIVNPASGKKGSTEAVLSKIHALTIPFEIKLTEKMGDAEHFARKFAEKCEQSGEMCRIYACGGDGTLNEVVNGVLGLENVAITAVSKGTGNDFVKMFPNCDFSDINRLVNSGEMEIDVLQCSDRACINVACAGLDARVADDVLKFKRLPFVRGKIAYNLALGLNIFLKGIAKPIKIEGEGLKFEGESTLMCVCNGRFYGGGFMPTGLAELNDSIFEILVVKKVGLFTLLKVVDKYAKGRYAEFPQYISAFRGQKLTLSSENDIVLAVDGEIMRAKRFDLSLSPYKLRFFGV